MKSVMEPVFGKVASKFESEIFTENRLKWKQVSGDTNHWSDFNCENLQLTVNFYISYILTD